MLGFPPNTELSRQLPKKTIYTKFQMNNAERAKIDADISRITIVNEVSAEKLHIAAGEKVKTFFVLLVTLKRKEFDVKTIIKISKLIPQKMLLVLECGGVVKLAIYYTKLMQTGWMRAEEHKIELKGLNLDTVWENIVIAVGGVNIEKGNSLDEQIEINDKRQILEKAIARIEKKARAEKQPKKKFELVEAEKKLKEQLKLLEG